MNLPKSPEHFQAFHWASSEVVFKYKDFFSKLLRFLLDCKNYVNVLLD